MFNKEILFEKIYQFRYIIYRELQNVQRLVKRKMIITNYKFQSLHFKSAKYQLSLFTRECQYLVGTSRWSPLYNHVKLCHLSFLGKCFYITKGWFLKRGREKINSNLTLSFPRTNEWGWVDFLLQKMLTKTVWSGEQSKISISCQFTVFSTFFAN